MKLKTSKKIFLPALFIISFCCFCLTNNVEAQKNTDYPENLWKGLIGETAGEFTEFGEAVGYESMYAAACVYRWRWRNRKPLGCVALKRRDLDQLVERNGEKYERIAKMIVKKIFEENGPDITGGATHYENVKKFGLPYWAMNMKITAKIGSHTFFQEKK